MLEVERIDYRMPDGSLERAGPETDRVSLAVAPHPEAQPWQPGSGGTRLPIGSLSLSPRFLDLLAAQAIGGCRQVGGRPY
jgi:hypothetical protein